jgi:hypothetical protein
MHHIVSVQCTHIYQYDTLRTNATSSRLNDLIMSVSIGSLLGAPGPEFHIAAVNNSPACALLADQGNFADYVSLLERETRFNATALKACRVEICNAIYGIGNPDISGIGVRPPMPLLLRS